MADRSRGGLLARYGPVLALLLLLTLGVAVVLLGGHVDVSQIGRAYALGVGAVVILVLVLELCRVGGGRSSWSDPQTEATPRKPAELVRLEDSLRASRVSPGQYELQVLPALREIARDRLLLLGISLEGDPERADQALGPVLRSALGEDPPWLAASRPGPSQRELATLVAELEALGG
ncbi:MAG: hypothetical protein WBA31_00405 [Candidatus Dormiibacterota bacterium]